MSEVEPHAQGHLPRGRRMDDVAVLLGERRDDHDLRAVEHRDGEQRALVAPRHAVPVHVRQVARPVTHANRFLQCARAAGGAAIIHRPRRVLLEPSDRLSAQRARVNAGDAVLLQLIDERVELAVAVTRHRLFHKAAQLEVVAQAHALVLRRRRRPRAQLWRRRRAHRVVIALRGRRGGDGPLWHVAHRERRVGPLGVGVGGRARRLGVHAPTLALERAAPVLPRHRVATVRARRSTAWRAVRRLRALHDGCRLSLLLVALVARLVVRLGLGLAR
mmetsp:Transcript_6638/g.20932  ORF Transcript_6638/g.20932 Transcript_6638/m.20932 type:complete len:275 (+) Transcript_6638:1696-2520(+)